MILAAAVALRMVYAYDLPLNLDERWQLELARGISLNPDRLHLPLGHPRMGHAMGAVYLDALGDWMGGGSVLVTRAVYLLMNTLGLVGLYLVCHRFFGRRAAVIALVLGALDRHLVAFGPFIQATPHLFLITWPLYLMVRVLDGNRWRDWVLLGLACGVAWSFYQLALLVPLAFVVYLATSRRLWSVLGQPQAYVAAAICLAVMAPSLAWDLANRAPTLGYITAKGLALGLTPRFLMLYVGGLIMCLVPPWRLTLDMGTVVHTPTIIPCAWQVGLAYLACLGYAMWRRRREEYGLLLTAVVVPAAVVTVFAPGEPLDNFTWAAPTLAPVLCLTAHVLDRLMDLRIGKVLVPAAAALPAVLISLFLSGPKWGYFCPRWEVSFLGRQCWYVETFRQADSHEDIVETVRQHPESAFAHAFHALRSLDPTETVQAVERAIEIEPTNPLALVVRAQLFHKQGNWSAAVETLRAAQDHGADTLVVRLWLADSLFMLNRLDEAEQVLLGALAMKPTEAILYTPLSRIRFRRGDMTGGAQALRECALRQNQPHEAYLDEGAYYAALKQPDMARYCWNQARRLKPDLAPPPWLPPPEDPARGTP